MAVWVDTHCHLQLAEADPGSSLERAEDVAWVVAPGVDLASSEASIALAESFGARVRPTAGLHPHDAGSWPVVRDEIAALIPRVAAVGETGLDFYRNLSPEPAQVDAFRAHHQLAVAHGLPLIVHCRDAFSRIHDILSTDGSGPWVVLHCWTGGPRWTKRFLDLGVTFSFAGPVAFETGDTVRRGAALVPPDRALVETDTPYLAPPPYRGEVNEPAHVALVGAALASVWSMDVGDVARVTSENAARVFGE